MTSRRYEMPFGTELRADGTARFSLWAPSARSVELCLITDTDDDTAPDNFTPMVAEDSGWFRVIADAPVGTRYLFRIDGEQLVPDPASRYQPRDVHGPSMLTDPAAYAWQDSGWQGRPWEESIIYELHVGSFSADGSFDGVIEKLDYLAGLGITAIELMPIADFPGGWNWGYDGVYLFAPDSRYGHPDRLKALVDEAHKRGIMVLLDVVYNHFGPEGNYLHRYAAPTFNRNRHTPWGATINFDGKHSRTVRDFFIHNAMFWLEEYHLDGLRLDAVHAMVDDSSPDILTELAAHVQAKSGDNRHIHLVLENDANNAHRLRTNATHGNPGYTAQWNDDLHHVLHHLLTGERHGYYQDYIDRPLQHLVRCLLEGFAYQGEPSPYRGAQPRGEPSAHLPATAFISFMQNHDHIGNRPCGERIDTLVSADRLRAVLTLLLLAPSPPLLFMGQEWNSSSPFPFFCDFEPSLAGRVVKGRRRDLAYMLSLEHPNKVGKFPDPRAESSFHSARLDWTELNHPDHAEWLELHRKLLMLRQSELTPRLRGLRDNDVAHRELGQNAFCISWTLADHSTLSVYVNLDDAPLEKKGVLPANPLVSTHEESAMLLHQEGMPPWFVAWYLT